MTCKVDTLHTHLSPLLHTHAHAHTHRLPTFTPFIFLCYLRRQLPVGDDFSDQAPLPVAGGVVDHLLPQQLADRHVLEAVALRYLQALRPFAAARATWAQSESCSVFFRGRRGEGRGSLICLLASNVSEWVWNIMRVGVFGVGLWVFFYFLGEKPCESEGVVCAWLHRVESQHSCSCVIRCSAVWDAFWEVGNGRQ